MRANEVPQFPENGERKLRGFHRRQSRGARRGHPRGQESPASVRPHHHEMDQARVDHASNYGDSLSSQRMMRIFDYNLREVFLGSMSWA